METPHVSSENFASLSLPDLYDLLADQTVRFNRMLLQKTAKEQMSSLKNEIKKIQEEIQKRKEVTSAG